MAEEGSKEKSLMERYKAGILWNKEEGFVFIANPEFLDESNKESVPVEVTLLASMFKRLFNDEDFIDNCMEWWRDFCESVELKDKKKD